MLCPQQQRRRREGEIPLQYSLRRDFLLTNTTLTTRPDRSPSRPIRVGRVGRVVVVYDSADPMLAATSPRDEESEVDLTAVGRKDELSDRRAEKFPSSGQLGKGLADVSLGSLLCVLRSVHTSRVPGIPSWR